MKRASFAIAVAIAVVGLAACHTPPPHLQLAFAGPPSQACPSTDCAMVPMTCPTVMSIRIVDPTDPTDPSLWSLSQCVLVSPQHGNMCALAGVDLESTPIPVRNLEVQVALYPATEIPSDPMNPDALLCPTNVEYSAATGFPVEQAPTPALGGHAFYHPGDQTVVVTLGCTDLSSIDQSCAVSNQVKVTATVKDFSTGLSVTGGPQGVADRLLVLVGEPSMVSDQFVLPPGETRSLDRTGDVPPVVWERDVDLLFRNYVCLEVLEDDAQSTATLRCRNATASKSLDLSGVWLAKTQLAKILLALGPSGFPEGGLTLGMVVDNVGNPVAGAVVSAGIGTVEYLSEQGSSFGAGATASNGIFVSRDAMFGTEFSTGGAGESTGIGGLVAGRITVVILLASAPAS